MINNNALKNLNYQQLIQNLNYFFALCFAFVMPLSKKMLPYIIGLWFLTWLLEGNYVSKFKKNRKNSLLFYVAVIFYIFHVIGLLYSTNMGIAIFDIQVKLTLIFAPLVFAISNKIYRIKSNEILLTFVLGNLTAVIICLIYAFWGSLNIVDSKLVFDPVVDRFYNRFLYDRFSLFHHVSYFAMYITFSIAIISYFITKKIFIQKKIWLYIFIISIILFIVAIYLLSSKAGILIGFFVVCISLISIILKYSKKYAPVVLGVFLLMATISFFYLVESNSRVGILVKQFSKSENKTSADNMRLNVWYSALLVIEENFVYGVGAGDIKDSLFEKYEENNFQTGVERSYNAHQQFLETLVGQGIIGLFLLLFIIIIPFYKSIEERNFLWFSLILIIFLNFLFESMLNTIAGVTFFGFFYGLTTFVPFENIRFKIPFSPPRIDAKIIHEVVDTLNSGWITTGPKTKKFESKITEYCGCERTLCVNSATSGLKLIIRWFGVGPGDEVIVPAYTYCATANVVIHSGAKLVFVDVNESDFNISINKIKNAITAKTKLIIPVDFSGYPCDYDEINGLVTSSEYRKIFHPSNDVQKKLGRILVLSDSAHSLGAVYKGKKTGSLTDVSVFSFHAVKNLTTGEGGAISLNFKEAFDNNDLYKQLNILALHGQTKDAFQKNNDGNWKYDIVDAGYKSNMTDISASMGLVELERYEQDSLKKFKETFQYYTEALKDKEWAITPDYYNEIKESSYHIYPLRIKGIDDVTRDEIMKRIFEKNVAVNVHFMPVPMFSFYKSLGYDIKNYPIAYKNYAAEITLPVFYDLTENQIDRVLNALIESVENVLFEKGSL